MSDEEYQTSVTDKQLQKILDAASDKLIEIVNQLETDEE